MLKLGDRNLFEAVFQMFKMLSRDLKKRHKNTLSRINNRLDSEEEKIREFKGIVIESIQNETEKRIFFIEMNQLLCFGTISRGLIMCSWKSLRKAEEFIRIFKKINAGNFSNLMKTIIPQI